MPLRILSKLHLSPPQLQQATQRIYSPEHSADLGPRFYWNRPEHDRNHLALFDLETEEFVGTVYCLITPPVAQDFTWWLDSRMRKKGYWRALADDLAAYLKRRGVERIGFILFGGLHLPASKKIAERLRLHFDKKAAAGASAANKRER